MKKGAKEGLEFVSLPRGQPYFCIGGFKAIRNLILFRNAWQNNWPRLQKLYIDVLLCSPWRQPVHLGLLRHEIVVQKFGLNPIGRSNSYEAIGACRIKFEYSRIADVGRNCDEYSPAGNILLIASPSSLSVCV